MHAYTCLKSSQIVIDNLLLWLNNKVYHGIENTYRMCVIIPYRITITFYVAQSLMCNSPVSYICIALVQACIAK